MLGPLLDWLGEWGGAVRQHHEKFDGTGYPDGAAGADICRGGRIVAIADSYEVMTAHRAYKKPMATVAARAELARCAGTQFDPAYVRAFLAIPLPKLLWAMGPASLLMNVPMLRTLADTANKGALATTQSTVVAASAAAVIGGVSAAGGAVPAAGQAQPVASSPGAVHSTTHRAASPARNATRPARAGKQTAAPRAVPTPTASPVSHRTPLAPPAPAPASTPAPPASTPSTPAPPPTTPAPPSTPAPPPSTPAPPPSTPAPPPSTPAPPSTPPVVPATAPGPVGSAAAQAGDRQATVSWTAPATDGGSPVTEYVVTPIGGVAPPAGTTVAAGTTSLTVSGLTNGTSYVFDIVARNAAGDSTAVPTAAVTPAGVPVAVSSPTAVAGNTDATVYWVPGDANGSAITGYTVTPVGPMGPLESTSVTDPLATSAQVTGLVNGQAYAFQIRAENAVGDSAPATTSSVTPAGPPSAPTGVAATAADKEATVFWTAADGNGTAITSYRVTPIGTSAPPPVDVSGQNTSAVITGLTDGDAYTFTVTAVSAVGSATSLPSGQVMPVAPPGNAIAPAAPVPAQASAGLSSATVSWTAPADGGAPITSYTVREIADGVPTQSWTLPPDTTSYVVDDLSYSSQYSFTIIATNGVGDSTAASTGTVVPFSVPGPVTNAQATGDDHGATVSWTAPSQNGGAAITGYTVTPIGPSGALAATHVGATATSAIITGLTDGASYTFRIVATNTHGDSTAVTTTAVVPAFNVRPDSAYTVHNGSVVVPVLANDDNASGATLMITGAPSHGTAVVSLVNHTISYTSVGPFTGVDHFTYQVCDSAGTCASAVVSVHVLAPDQKQTDFTGVDLAGANLQGVDLSNNATLAGLDLAGANLTNANLTNTDVSRADLTGANLTNANLNATDLSRTDLTQAVLTQAKLQNADLTNATLAGLDLSGRDLTGADLSGADLSGTNLSHANLNNVTVTNATNLTGTNLTGVTGGPPPPSRVARRCRRRPVSR